MKTLHSLHTQVFPFHDFIFSFTLGSVLESLIFPKWLPGVSSLAKKTLCVMNSYWLMVESPGWKHVCFGVNILVNVSPIYNPYAGEVPVRKDTCPGPLALWGRVNSPFPRHNFLPSASNRSLFAVGWTVSEHPSLDLKCITNRVSSAQLESVLPAILLVPLYYYYTNIIDYVKKLFLKH